MAETAYGAALKMLARRELSEAQVRQRLARREHAAEDIDAAVERLKANRSLDDERVAGAIARMETGIRKRGRLRVQRQIAAAGIASAVAKRVVDDTFGALDEAALLEAALQKRLRGRDRIADDREYARLYRYLLGQGYDSAAIRAALRKAQGPRPKA